MGGGEFEDFLEGGAWWERGGQFLQGGSGFWETAIINFTSQILFDLYLCADWKMLYHLLFFTYVFKLISFY